MISNYKLIYLYFKNLISNKVCEITNLDIEKGIKDDYTRHI